MIGFADDFAEGAEALRLGDIFSGRLKLSTEAASLDYAQGRSAFHHVYRRRGGNRSVVSLRADYNAGDCHDSG
jgi:hypothetical protein